MQAKDGMQARAIGTAGERVRAKAKTGKGVVRPKNRQNDWSTPAWKGKSSTKGSNKGSIFSVDEARLTIRRRIPLLHADQDQSAE